MTDHTHAIEMLAEDIGVDLACVERAYRLTALSFAAHRRSNYLHFTDEQYRRMIFRDRFPVACVASIALRLAGRRTDALLLMDVFRASQNTTSTPRPPIGRGVGTLPEHHDHHHVQDAIRILQAAHLPPIVTDGTHAISDGFQVMPGGPDLPGWVLVDPDPDCEQRAGFAGGHVGYAAVLRWAGWGVIPVLEGSPLIAACHPDLRDQHLAP